MRNYSMVLTEKQLKRIMYNTYPNKDYFELMKAIEILYSMKLMKPELYRSIIEYHTHLSYTR